MLFVLVHDNIVIPFTGPVTVPYMDGEIHTTITKYDTALDIEVDQGLLLRLISTAFLSKGFHQGQKQTLDIYSESLTSPLLWP